MLTVGGRGVVHVTERLRGDVNGGMRSKEMLTVKLGERDVNREIWSKEITERHKRKRDVKREMQSKEM